MAYGSPFNRDLSVQPVGAITATPARVLRRNGIRVLKLTGVRGRGRRRR